MAKKIFLFDFDGTIVTEDILDVVCDIVGKKEESRLINEKTHTGELTGLQPLCDRINFLHGISYEQIKEKLNEESYLRKGTVELFEYLRANNFITVLSSGNIIPVLRYYKELLGIDYVFGANPKMNGEVIDNIEVSDFSGKDFKYNSCLDVIKKYKVEKNEVYGIGDSVHDVKMLSLAGHLEENETIKEAAIREVYEETGCKVKLTGVLPVIHKFDKNENAIMVRFVAKIEEENIKFNENEILDVKWIDIEDIKNMKEDELRGYNRSLKFLDDYENNHIYPVEVFE